MSNLTVEPNIRTRAARTRLGDIIDEVEAPLGTFTTLSATTFTSTTISVGTVSATTVTATTGAITGATTAPTVSAGALSTGSLVGTTTGTNTLNSTTLNAQNLTATGTVSITTVPGSFGATTKGDIVTHNGTSITRLPVGSNGQILSANSATATGLQWIAGVTSASATPTVAGTVYGLNSSTNTAVGQGALSGITSGLRNTALGRNAGSTITTGTDNVVVGTSAAVSAAGATNQVVLGASTTGASDNSLTVASAVTALRMAGMTTVTSGNFMSWITGSINRMTPSWGVKGDLLTFTGGAYTVQALGTDGYALVANSAASSGLNWAALRSLTSGNYRYGLQTSAQNITNNVATNFAPTPITGGAGWQINLSGLYIVQCEVTWTASSTGTRRMWYFDAGLTVYEVENQPTNGTNWVTQNLLLLLRDITSPQIYVLQNSGGTIQINGDPTTGRSHLGIFFLG